MRYIYIYLTGLHVHPFCAQKQLLHCGNLYQHPQKTRLKVLNPSTTGYTKDTPQNKFNLEHLDFSKHCHYPYILHNMGSSEQIPSQTQQPFHDRDSLTQRTIPWMKLGDASSTITAPPKPFGDDVSPTQRAMLRFAVQGNAICMFLRLMSSTT